MWVLPRTPFSSCVFHVGLFSFLVLGSSLRAETLLPLTSESARPLSSGEAEFILGGGYFRDLRFPLFTGPGALQSQTLVTAPEIAFRVGAGGWAEIQATFEGRYLKERTSSGERNEEFGQGDATLAAKVRAFREGDYLPAIGVRFVTKLPNANRDKRLGTDETDFGLHGLVSKEVGPIDTHVSLGFLLLGNPGPTLGAPDRLGKGQDDVVTYSAAIASLPLALDGGEAWSVRIVSEVAGLTGSHNDNDRSAVRVGAQFEVGDWLIYSGVSAGLMTASENIGAQLGVAYTVDLQPLFGSGD